MTSRNKNRHPAKAFGRMNVSVLGMRTSRTSGTFWPDALAHSSVQPEKATCSQVRNELQHVIALYRYHMRYVCIYIYIYPMHPNTLWEGTWTPVVIIPQSHFRKLQLDPPRDVAWSSHEIPWIDDHRPKT